MFDLFRSRLTEFVQHSEVVVFVWADPSTTNTVLHLYLLCLVLHVVRLAAACARAAEARPRGVVLPGGSEGLGSTTWKLALWVHLDLDTLYLECWRAC